MMSIEFINGLINHFKSAKKYWEEELSRAKDQIVVCEEAISTYEETIEYLKKMADEAE